MQNTGIKQNISLPDLERSKEIEHTEGYVMPDWRKRLGESRKATKSAPILAEHENPLPTKTTPMSTTTVPVALVHENCPIQTTSTLSAEEPISTNTISVMSVHEFESTQAGHIVSAKESVPVETTSILSTNIEQAEHTSLEQRYSHVQSTIIRSEKEPIPTKVVPDVLEHEPFPEDALMVLNLDTGLMEPMSETLPQREVEKLAKFGFRGRFRPSNSTIKENDAEFIDCRFDHMSHQLDGASDTNIFEIENTRPAIEAAVAQITISTRQPSSNYSRKTSSEHSSRHLSYHLSLSRLNRKRNGRGHSGAFRRTSSGSWAHPFQKDYQECLQSGRFDSSSEDSLPRDHTIIDIPTISRTEIDTEHRQSRFTEHLEDEFDAHPATTHMERLTLARSYDGTEDRSAGGRRGYGFDVIARENEQAANLWERTLQAHAWEMSTENAKVSKGRGRISPALDRIAETKTPTGSSFFLGRPSSAIRRLTRSKSVDTMNVAPDFVIEKPNRRKHQWTRSTDSWTRFPSHTRSERSGSAGSSDNVTSYDFAMTIEPKSSLLTNKRHKKHRKTHSMTFGIKDLVHTLANRYKNERGDFLRLEKGHRSSVSTGGVLRYPDLELLPKLSPVVMTPLGPDRDEVFSKDYFHQET